GRFSGRQFYTLDSDELLGAGKLTEARILLAELSDRVSNRLERDEVIVPEDRQAPVDEPFSLVPREPVLPQERGERLNGTDEPDFRRPVSRGDERGRDGRERLPQRQLQLRRGVARSRQAKLLLQRASPSLDVANVLRVLAIDGNRVQRILEERSLQ